MEVQFASLPLWLSVVDFENEYAQDLTSETPVFVDVGGGAGQQVIASVRRSKFPLLISVDCCSATEDSRSVQQADLAGYASRSREIDCH